jgi:hypothetical protein
VFPGFEAARKRGSCVRVCDVEVMDELVLLVVLAMAVRSLERKFFEHDLGKFYRGCDKGSAARLRVSIRRGNWSQ